MKRITTLTFEFEYASTPTSEMCVSAAYARIFEEAKRNLIAKGLLKPTHNDIDSSEITSVDTINDEDYPKSNGTERGIFDHQGSSGQTQNLEGNSCPNGSPERDSGGQSRDGLANQQPILN